MVIDLRQGAFSNIGQSSSVSISYGSHIEDAVGGNGNDRITGNEGDNRLDGGLGSDVLTGLAGADTFVIKGNDRIDDFENGIDQIDWQGVEFASLSVTQSGSNALVSDGVNSALLLNTSVADVDSSDFTGAFV